MDGLLDKYPQLEEFYRILMDRGESPRAMKTKMVELNNLHGDKYFAMALRIAKKRGMHHPSQLSKLLMGIEKAEGKAPKPLHLSGKEELSKLEIRSHDLTTYDIL